MTAYLKHLKLENIRGFQELDLSFGEAAPRMLTCLIGRNGTNKTTLLRMMALGFCSQTGANILLRDEFSSLRRHQTQSSTISIRLTTGPGYTSYDYEVSDTELKFIGRTMESGKFGKFGVGYGVSRGEPSGMQRERLESHQPLESLFRDHHPLLNSELALRRIQDIFSSAQFDQLMEQIKTAVGFQADDRIDLVKGGGIAVTGSSTASNTIPLHAWADGYKRSFFWIVDLYVWAILANALDESGQVQGVLLIDEVEQHLHPSMQAHVLRRLRQLFPKMQLVVTTHSPLVALGCQPNELVVLKQEGDHIVAHTRLPNFQSYSVEDMLTDANLFDTEPYSPVYAEKLREYNDLARVPKERRTEAQTKSLMQLARYLKQ